MSGLCGWIGDNGAPASNPETLEIMAGALPALGATARETGSTEAGALSLNAMAAAGWWIAEDGVLVAIEGRPRWRDRKFADLAAQHGHAAALGRAWREAGENFLPRLGGAFALAVIDIRQRKGLIAIDRLGIQTLCYSTPKPGLLVFGSTTDSVRAHPAVRSTIRPQAIHDYLFFIDRIPAPGTIYEEQSKLLPGEYIAFENGRVEKRFYWRMPYRENSGERFEDLGPEMMEHLGAAVSRGLEGEKPEAIGAFLSGGLDSSTVAGLFAERTPAHAKTFTIGFDVDGFDESAYARIAAEHFGTQHHEYYVTPDDVFETISWITRIYDEPFGNSSAVPTYICARLAREAGVEIMLAGDGGDEIFAGNERYLGNGILDHYTKIPAWLRRGIIEPAIESFPGTQQFTPLRRIRNYIRDANMPPWGRMANQNLYRYTGYREVFSADFAADIDPRQTLLHLEGIFAGPDEATTLQRLLQVDMRITLADGDLRKVNRMCEAAGVRVHYPFLDDDVVEFSGRVPGDMLIRDGRLRDFYKRAVADFLPRQIIEKTKHGFGLPFMETASNIKAIREMALDSLQGLKMRGCFSTAWLEGFMVAGNQPDFHHLNGTMWDLMILEQWLQHHFDRQMQHGLVDA